MKRSQKLLQAMSLADESYVKEADPSLPIRTRRKGKLISLIAACLAVVLIAGNLFLFLPYRTDRGDITKYAKSEYFPVIEKLHALTVEKPKYKNRFEMLSAGVSNLLSSAFRFGMKGQSAEEAPAPGMNGAVDWDMAEMEGVAADDRFMLNTANGIPYGKNPESSEHYEETTDNQVSGIIEADRIKRSNKHIFYLDGSTLRIFSIAGKDSKELGAFEVYGGKKDYEIRKWELFLSEDCKTVTVMTVYMEKKQLCTGLVALDVSDPENIRESGRFAITGSYISSRSMQDQYLLVTEYVFDKSQMNFSKPETYLPQIDLGEGLAPMPMESIVIPEEVNSTRYTVALLLDAKTLAMDGAMAHLSYTDDLYVSNGRLYLARVYADDWNGSGGQKTTMTEITCLAYGDGSFRKEGSVSLRGYIKDQWSMDEYEGILRVVTTTNQLESYHFTDSYHPVSGDRLQSATGGSSASLYCVDTETWETVAAVEDFAPRHEEVQSVRFDGTAAYVCTSIEMSDPVFFFDLSDLSNITYKDTGNINGYSSSLVNFGNGMLLGIGQGSWNTLKIEVYEETENGVRSVAKYEREGANYSSNYKSYLIDREHQLVGLGISSISYKEGSGNDSGSYLLLHFSGYSIAELVDTPLAGDCELQRGLYISGYLYAFGDHDFQVVEIPELGE